MSETDSTDGGPADADEKGPAAAPDNPVIEPLDDAPEGFEPV
ncbi:hypothetical protein [Nonomuraea sp. LPB2021202275-12-8]